MRTTRHDGSSKRVLHSVLGFGAASETFIGDRMFELDRLGWEAWVGANWLVDEPIYEFPAPERVILPRPRDELMRRLRPRRSDRDWWRLERPIAKARPALIHSHFGWAGVESIGAAEHYGIPLAVGFHGYDTTVYPHYGFNVYSDPAEHSMPPGIYDELFAKAACIFATSQFIASKLRKLGCKRDIEVVTSGIRLDCFPFRGARTGTTSEDFRALYVGRLVPYKGLDTAIRAVATLADAGGEAPTLTVVGGGPARADYESLAQELGIADRIEFRGRQPRPAVLDELREADVLILASRTTPAGQAEGLGNVVKEALAVGLEVAVSDNGGLPEVMPPERIDELVPEGDVTALAERLDAIGRSRDEWPERAQDGRRWVEETFDWRKLAPRLADAYGRVTA